jgi:hypothetical protein
MSSVVTDWDGPGTGFRIDSVVAYVDTIRLFCFRPLPPQALQSLRSDYGKNLIAKTFTMPAQAVAGHRLRPAMTRSFISINQPRRATLKYLATIQHRLFVVNAVHVAVDFLCSTTQEAEKTTRYLDRGCVQKWRRKGLESRLAISTRYWNHGRARRNIALYGDRLSKPHVVPCAHLELRFTGAEACKAAKLGDLQSIDAGVDVLSLLRRQAKVAFIDPKRLERAIEKMARNTVFKNARHRRRRGPSTTTIDSAKARIRELLARGLQEEQLPLNSQTVARARSQELCDQRLFRTCLASPLDWANLVPTPTWFRW